MENPNSLNSNMMKWMLASLIGGLLLGGSGLYLLIFTEITIDQGLPGIAVVVTLITIGLLLIVPAKIYLILRFTRIKRR